MSDETKKKRGRPPLTDAEREKRRIESNKRQAERLKRNGYAAQKKYHTMNDPAKEREWRKESRERQRGKVYEPKIRIQIDFKPTLMQLMTDTGLSLTALCLTALEEKYGVVLQKSVDSSDKQ